MKWDVDILRHSHVYYAKTLVLTFEVVMQFYGLNRDTEAIGTQMAFKYI